MIGEVPRRKLLVWFSRHLAEGARCWLFRGLRNGGEAMHKSKNDANWPTQSFAPTNRSPSDWGGRRMSKGGEAGMTGQSLG